METKFRRLVMTAGAVLMTFWASAAFAQDVVHLGSGGSDQSWAGTSNTSLAGFWLDQGALSSGDDRKDLIIGAPGGSTQPGHAYVIFGGPVRTGDNLLSSADVIFNGGVGGDRFGTSTAAGNVISAIGSGPRDLVIGAPSANSGAGAVYVYRGGFTNNQVKNISDAAVTILGAAGDQLGTSLATADLNNDGYREIVIGAPGNGRVYVIDGAASLSGTIDLSTHSASSVITGTLIGYTMAAGDVDGDGIYDLLIGAPKKSSETGAVYLLKGRNGGLPTTVALDTNADAMFSGINPGDNAGSAIKLGDFDDDGHTDILIGADGADGPSGNVRGNAGSAYILWGGPGLTGKNLASADVTIYGAAAGDLLGTAADTGDVNRDTPNDIVLAAPGAGSGGGAIYVIYGRTRAEFGHTMDMQTAANRIIYGSAVDGASTATAVYEVTGEGARDIIVGYPFADSASHTDNGRVYFSLSPKLVPPTSVSLSAPAGTPTSVTVTIANPGTGTVPWKVQSNASWMTVSPTTGSSTSASSGTFTLTATTSDSGTFSGSFTVTSLTQDLDMTLVIPVTLTAGLPVNRNPDVNGDGTPESSPVTPRIVLGRTTYTTDGGWFETRSGSDFNYGEVTTVRQPWMPYNAANGELHVAVGDVDGDGLDETVIGFGSGGAGWLIILDDDQHNYAILKWIRVDWGAYNQNTGGATWPAVGDIDGDGKAEIVVGLGQGGGGWFQIFDDASTGFASLGWRRVQWDPYNANSGETHPAVGDFDGDGKAEIIVGLGNMGAGWVEMFGSSTTSYNPSRWLRIDWDAYNMNTSGATFPAAGDIDGDGKAEIVVGLGQGGGGWLRVFDDATTSFAPVRWLQTTFPEYNSAVGETHPAIGNIDGDAAGEIVIGLASYSNRGGWFELRDDGNHGNAVIKWGRATGDAFNNSGGGLFPAIGKLR